jgi:ribosome maturation factor RimP
VRTAAPLDGRSKFKGYVRDAGTDALILEVDGANVDIPYEAIVRSNLIDER